jgi:diguanylate cyclase (GGDEF)-like protein
MLSAIFFVCFIPSDYAAGQSVSTNHYVQIALTDKNGLPQNSVNAIAQTPNGYLWFGTEEGLARFDGVHVTVFDSIHYKSLKDNYIEAITAGRDGSLWVGTRSGLVCLKDGVFHEYFTARAPITAIIQSRGGGVWVGSGDGLYFVNGVNVRHFTVADGLPSNSINSILENEDGTLWIGTGKGLVSLKQGKFRAYGPSDHLPGDSVVKICSAGNGKLWIATAGGLVRWNPLSSEATRVKKLPFGARITSLFDGGDGRLWIGFDHSGIASYYNGEITSYNARNELPSNDITQIFQDAEGNLWVGLFEGGAVELRSSRFETIGIREGLSEDMVWSVLEARDGSLWIGTNSKGLNHVDRNGRVRVYGAAEGWPGGSVFALHEAADGSLWVGSEHGELAHLVHDHFTIFRDPAGGDSRVTTILSDSTGDLLIGFHAVDGLVRFHRGQFQHYKVPGLLNTFTIAPDGSIWVGTDHSGVSHLDHGSIRTYTKSDGLLSDFAQAIYVDREGVAWAGTSPGGLNRIEGGKIITYSIQQGLFDLTVGAIVEDELGNLWMTCNKGIYKVSKKELTDFAHGLISEIHSTVYGIVDGLRSAECNFAADPSVWKSPDGHLWFATTSGVAGVNPANSEVKTSYPKPYIESARFNGKPADLSQGLNTGPGSGNVEIQFTAPDFVAPERIHFRYRLRGFDTEWAESGARREAIYTRVPPGSYVFAVQAADSGSGWGDQSAELKVIVRPFFWQTSWFRAICGVGLLALCYGTYKIRIRFLLERTRKLEERVNQRTVELREAIKVAESAQQALREQAMRDGLTNLWNRRATMEMLENEILRANREGDYFCLLMCDLDHFKAINDTFGHLAGDRVLQEVAARIQHLIRSYDCACRYGGEEFMLVLPGCSLEVGVVRAEELRRAIAVAPFKSGTSYISATWSVGIAEYAPGSSAAETIQKADDALYCAKKLGRNRVECNAPESDAVSDPIRV